MNYNEEAQLYEKVDESTGQLYSKDLFNVVDYNTEGTAMLQDGIFVWRSEFQTPEKQDLASRFVKASLKGWATCRDDAAYCASLFYDGSGDVNPHQIWQMNEINQLIWPVPGGVGVMNQTLYDQTVNVGKANGVFPATADFTSDFTNQYASLAEAQLRAEGVDTVGAGYVPDVVEFCLDAQGQLQTCSAIKPAPKLQVGVIIAIVAACVIVVVALVVVAIFLRKRKLEQSVFLINPEEVEHGEMIGLGGFAAVFKAKWKGLDVAVKKFALTRDGLAQEIQQFKLNGQDPGNLARTNLLADSRNNSVAVTKSNSRGPAYAYSSSRPTMVSTAWSASATVTSTEDGKNTRDNPAQALNSFKNEVAVIRHFRHPNVLYLYGVYWDNKVAAMVLEYMPQGSLHDVLSNPSFPLSWKRRCEFAIDITSGLTFLHSQEPAFLHQDIKSFNCLLDSRFNVKISDFGLSAVKTRSGNTKSSGGSIPWTAPEVIRTRRATEASDVFSLGITLWEIASRDIPYRTLLDEAEAANNTDPPLVIIRRAILDGIRPPIDPSWPTEFVALMKQCWNEEPSERPSADQVLQTLEDIMPVMSDDDGSESNSDLLRSMLTSAEIAKVKAGEHYPGKLFEDVTVLFSDVVGFTTLSATLPPEDVSSLLERLFRKFDALLEETGCTKIETIGDAYILGAGLLDPPHEAPHKVARMAVRMLDVVEDFYIKEGDPSSGRIQMRIGAHCGPVSGTVIGSTHPKYTLLGDTMNTASRMESTAKPNTAQLTSDLGQRVKGSTGFKLTYNVGVDIKGKGKTNTYTLTKE
eukprot:TRINITY_DN1599_c0_g1_i2.p1 TRINITY_DN1599_c0_g1~~TRINITY_DN1599_c0_g1_i2.p1  ORF type:complete len:804 (-),score=238.09 TRINITY_DN1599_c0_g1_i2:16-2427(-)